MSTLKKVSFNTFISRSFHLSLKYYIKLKIVKNKKINEKNCNVALYFKTS